MAWPKGVPRGAGGKLKRGKRSARVAGEKRGPKPFAKKTDLNALEDRVTVFLKAIAEAVGAKLPIAPPPPPEEAANDNVEVVADVEEATSGDANGSAAASEAGDPEQAEA